MNKISGSKKAVFLDIDGTLILRDGTFPESAQEAMRRAKENGHHMVLCTGRCKAQITSWFPMELLSGIVSCAGSCVTYGDEVIYQKLMDKDRLAAMTVYFRQNNMPFYLQAEDAIYTNPWAAKEGWEAFLELGRTQSEIEKIFGQIQVAEHPEQEPGIEKALYYRCKKPAAEVQNDLTDYFNVTDSSYKVTRFCDGEITCSGIDKASGMQHYLDRAGISREDSIAVGDGPNDLEMIAYAHTGVAMGNSIPALKKEAGLVCGRVDEDGLYGAFQTLGLI